ncbi:EPHB6 isoform 4 [Pan troglodytes]|uniref:EPH receptor B6 n=3 Tax=Hominidae TaxID=9604 RepID=A0A087WZL4_HUMAN|nr:EPH receptor B6 [Homo sapiens]KAI4016158.1 EPH receptor B6 [Homo sapiens]PNI99878.1 EPHB6 isoform 4 [Pan troglodytes]PNJ51877.1 EPHB6 isoform 9 [Pongo abelii]
MATEGAAQLGNRVAGMVCSLWVLLLVSSVLALEVGRGECSGRPATPDSDL